jgi:hypothetical protein
MAPMLALGQPANFPQNDCGWGERGNLGGLTTGPMVRHLAPRNQHGEAGPGMAWHGEARHGEARTGRENRTENDS